jgi:hypothetical protein
MSSVTGSSAMRNSRAEWRSTWRALDSPAPDFSEVEALLMEARRRGNQDVGRTAIRSILPLRAVSGEEIGSLLRSHAELQEAIIAAGKELKSRGAPS